MTTIIVLLILLNIQVAVSLVIGAIHHVMVIHALMRDESDFD